MKIWILNHYATNMYFDKAGRHHSLAKYLVKKGHKVTIYCANTIHNSDKILDTGKAISITKEGDSGVNYVFLKTRPYCDNGKMRILNMIDYFVNLKKATRNCMEKPDIILASSVHPLALIAGEKIAHKWGIPCICEIRDLWPETLVELGIIKRNSFMAKVLYRGERHIYIKADQLIFTMPGGRDYIIDQHWEDKVSLKKIHHINNGVDLEKYDYDKELYKINDPDLDDNSTFKIIYAGSIRKANKIDEFIAVAELLKKYGRNDIKILIYGDGDQKNRLEAEGYSRGLDNLIFKGRVKKEYIPYILSKGNLNAVIDESNGLGKYGISWNKIFEYMASGNPTVIDYNMMGYNIVAEYGFGIAKEYIDAEEFCKDVLYMADLTEEKYEEYSCNARKAAKEYDYSNLANKLEKVLQEAIRKFEIER